MDQPRFDLVFSGRTVPGADSAQVRARLAALFKTDEASIERLFSGKRYVLKKGLDEAAARKYQAALDRAGAQCELVQRPPAMTIAPPGVTLVEVEPPATPEFDVSGFTLAEAGADVLDEYPRPAAPALDVSDISLAAPGEDLVEEEIVVAAPPVVPELSVAAIGAVLDEAGPATRSRPIPKTDHLSVAPVGVDLGDSQ